MDEEIQVQNDVLLKLNNDDLKHDEKEDKTPTRGLREGLKHKDYRINFYHSLVVSFSYFTLGFQAGQKGPSFLDLQLISGTDVEKASAYFTAHSIGFLCGSVVSGVLIDRFNKVLLLTISVFFIAVTCAVIPLCSWFGLMLFMFWFNAVFCGIFDTAGNADLLSIWKRGEGRPYMQAIHFSFALGGVISPLVTAPFLTPDAENQEQNKYISESESAIFVANVTSNYTLEKFTTTTEEVGEIRLIYAYIISGILTLVGFFTLLVMFLKIKSSKVKKAKKEEEKRTRNMPLKYYILCLVLINSFFAFYASVEDTFIGYLLTFTVLHLKWTKTKSSQLSALFWGSFAVSRFLGIFFSGCLRPSRMMFICIVTLMISLLLFLLCALFEVSIGIWFFTVCVGFSLSVIFPTGFTWTQENLLDVTGKVASSLMVSSCAGAMLNPLIIGYLMEEIHPMWFCYLLISHSILCVIIFIILLVISKKVKTTHTTMELEIKT